MLQNPILSNTLRTLARRNVGLCHRAFKQMIRRPDTAHPNPQNVQDFISSSLLVQNPVVFRCFTSRIDLDYYDLIDLKKRGDVTIIDVREPNELEEYGKIPDSINIPMGQLSDALQMPSDKFQVRFGVKKPPEDGEGIIFHCLAGVRSEKAMNASHKEGFIKAKHYKGGWEDYAEKTGQPIKKKPSPAE